MLAVKTPTHRQAVSRFHGDVVAFIADLVTQTPERWKQQITSARKAGFLPEAPDQDDEELRLIARAGQYKVQTTTERHLALEMSAWREVRAILGARQWTLLVADKKKTGFICSDYPVSLAPRTNPRESRCYHFGHATPDTEVFFPVSNSVALVGSFETPASVLQAQPEFIAFVNTRTAAFARRQVYARDENFLFLDVNGSMQSGEKLLQAQVFKDRP